jgi:hypothetical protein
VGFRLAISACQENSNPTSPDAGLAPAAARSSQGPELPSAAEESTPYWQPLQSAQATQIATEVADPVYVRKGPGCPANNGSLAITGSFNISSDDYTNTLGGCLMPLVYTVTNAGKAPLTLQLLGRTPSADFRISDSRGRLVWSQLRGQTLHGALRLFPLDAGKSLSFRERWNQSTDAGRPAAPGEYLVRGVLMTDDPAGLASPPARLLIER